eukprot:115632_1
MAETLTLIDELLSTFNEMQYDTNQQSATHQFLDTRQYTRRGVLVYEKVYGQNFISAGGVCTTQEFVDKYLDLKYGQSVLDVGCGIGGSAFYIAQHFAVYVLGIDLSSNMIQIANERLQPEKTKFDSNASVSFELCDATKRNFPDHSFDVIYSRDAILHIYDKLALFKSFFKWLKPGGTLFITDYCCGNPPYSRAFRQYVHRFQYHLHTISEYTQIINKAGFIQLDGNDATNEFCRTLQIELDHVQQIKSEFIAEFSQHDYDHIVNGWKDKLVRCCEGDQTWGKFCARKPI